MTPIVPRALDDPKLQEIVRRLVSAFEPEQIYLFGSQARGDAGPESQPIPVTTRSPLPSLRTPVPPTSLGCVEC